MLRFKLDVPPGKIIEFTVHERCLREQREGLRNLSYQGLQKYFENKFLDKHTYEKLKALLDALAEVARLEKAIAEQEKQRSQVYAAQDQVQKKMAVLAKDGEEGRLRGRYVKQLTQQEETLAEIDKTIADTRADIEKKLTHIDQMIAEY
jgi:phage shock protein A